MKSDSKGHQRRARKSNVSIVYLLKTSNYVAIMIKPHQYLALGSVAARVRQGQASPNYPLNVSGQSNSECIRTTASSGVPQRPSNSPHKLLSEIKTATTKLTNQRASMTNVFKSCFYFLHNIYLPHGISHSTLPPTAYECNPQSSGFRIVSM